MGKHLVLAGGGHAHLTTIVSIGEFVDRGHRVTVVGPSTHHYYSGMGPGMLGGFYEPDDIRFPVKEMTESRGGAFIQDRIERIDPQERIVYPASGEPLTYDVISFNVGSSVPADLVRGPSQNVLTVKPIENLLEGRERISSLVREKRPRLLVVGGGPAGLEIMGNVCRLVQDNHGAADATLVSGPGLLAGYPAKARRLAGKSLASRGVDVLENAFVERIEQDEAHLRDGRRIPFDLCFIAVGVRPSSIFEASGLPVGEGGGLVVNQYLHCPDHPGIFGGGDCISYQPKPLDKVGVYAVRENPVLKHNLLASLEGGPLQKFNPGGVFLLIFNLGDGRAIFCRKSLVWDGKAAFRLKDFIDRRFMRSFKKP